MDVAGTNVIVHFRGHKPQKTITTLQCEDVQINMYTRVCEYGFYIYVCMNITFLQRSEYGNNSANNFQGESPKSQSFYKSDLESAHKVCYCFKLDGLT